MKIGRNDLCPCGSGRKYKKCCIFKETDVFTKILPKLQQSPVTRDMCGVDEDDDFDETLFLANALNDLHRLMLKNKPHIKQYIKLRKMHGKILDSMMDYYDDGNFEQKIDKTLIPQYNSENKKGHDTVFLLESHFDMETSEGSQAFADTMVYKNFPNVECITEEFIKTNRYRLPEKIEFLHSMLDAKLGLFETIKVDSDEGYAYIKEVFTGREYKLTDVGLSGSSYYANNYIYSRIITYRGISFNSGLNLVFAKKDVFMQDFVKRHKKNYNAATEFVRFTELYNYFVNNPDRINIIRNNFNR